MINFLTVDIEDWQQSTLDQNMPISERVLRNSNRMLNILKDFGVHGTFFVQSMVAQQYPDLVRRISDEGHEIATHGHGHVPLFNLTPSEFAEDLSRSLDILQQLVPHPIHGYRAPDFSIRQDTLWALDVLKQQGIQYSSSVYPFRGSRYGLPGIPLYPHEIAEGLTEVPLSVVRLAGRNWPVAGGGYFRFLPYWVTRRAIRHMNSEGRAAVVYLHPYELDCQEMRQFRGHIPWRLYLSQSLNRHRTESKVRSLLGEFKFAPIREIVLS